MEWKTVPIRDLIEGLYDGPHATPKPSDSGPIFLGIKNVTEDGSLDLSDIRHIAEDDFATWTRRVEPRTGDLVFTYEATLNRYSLIPEGFKGCLGRRMALIRPDSEKLDIRYLLYYFFTPEWRSVISNNTLSGSTVDRIPIAKFPDFPVRVPSLRVQRFIANTLANYDQLIELNQKRIVILEELARSLYREWFVNFRFPGHEGVRMVGSPMRKIPEGWVYSTLENQCDLVMGQSPKSEFYNLDGEGLPFHQGVSDFGERFPYDRLFCNVEGRIAQEGDILFSVRAPVGRLNIADKKIIIGRGLSAIRDRQGFQSFLWEQLRYMFQKEDIIGNGAIFAAVTKDDMRKIELLVPDKLVLRKADETFNKIHGQIAVLSKSIVNLRCTRDLLLPRLLSGKIQLKDLDQAPTASLQPSSAPTPRTHQVPAKSRKAPRSKTPA